ncbi:hypothetical protein [Escherichia coli]|nr:hypothetical protein [Escherichia coli]MCH6431606.1 hypothetical protein [Escherichia coli]
MSTQPLMKHEVVLPVIVDGYHWACNQDRMWNLNEPPRVSWRVFYL